MASVEIREVPSELSFEEVRSCMYRAMQELNRKRAIHKTEGFGQVFVTEVLIHPFTKEKTIVISFSDKDTRPLVYMRREWKWIKRIARARSRTSDERWYFVKGDLSMT